MIAGPLTAGDGTPEQVSYYRLERMLGRGGFGVVYAATDVRFNMQVAVNLLHPHLTDDEAYRERFLRETHVVSLLRSLYTVQVHQSGISEGRYFLVMDLIDGGTVADQLRSGPLAPKRALRIAGQVARSLEEAELRGITHRDIKPENVMLTADGTAQIVDFGIPRQAGAGTLTGTGQFVGTPVYTAPETPMGRADHGSDIYSLGGTLYHMLTGRPPFSGEPLQVLVHHERTPPPEPLDGLPLAAVGARHPLAGQAVDDAKLHVFFLADAPGSAAVPGLDASRYTPDEFMLDGRELYVHYPNGQGRSKLTVAQVERACETTATAQNWRTVGKLLEITNTAEQC